MSLGQIIRKKREELNLTLDEVSSRIGFSKPYLSTIETGKVKSSPSDQLLTKLEKILEFEEGLLLHIAHMEQMPSDIRQEYESVEAENERWRQFIKNLIHTKSNYSQLNTLLAKSDLSTEKSRSPLAAGWLVPVINKVVMGYPSDFDDLDYPSRAAVDYVRCPDLHDPNCFAVRVVGDSMMPKFHEGDIVVFSPAAQVQSGDDCFVRFAFSSKTTFIRVFFEQNDKIRLQPRNENYCPETVDAKEINSLYRAVIKCEKL